MNLRERNSNQTNIYIITFSDEFVLSKSPLYLIFTVLKISDFRRGQVAYSRPVGAGTHKPSLSLATMITQTDAFSTPRGYKNHSILPSSQTIIQKIE